MHNNMAISEKGIPMPLVSRSWLNLLVKEVKSDALIGQKQVKRERESKGLGIPIFYITREIPEAILRKSASKYFSGRPESLRS